MADKPKSIDPKSFMWPKEPSRMAGGDLDGLLEHLSQFEVSDITFQTNQVVIAEIYGDLRHITLRQLTNTEVGDILNFIYGQNGTTRLLSGQDIDTSYDFRADRNTRYRYRVNGTACQVDGHDAIQVTLRTIQTDPLPLESLGLPDKILQAITPEDGCVYITGATGSGKSTLLASTIRYIVEKPDANRKVLTYEAPIEFVYDDVIMPSSIVSQSEIPRHLPSFADGVRNALRRKPRLIMVGEARDYNTINAVLEAALTGHPVYTTVHSNGVAETVRRLVGSYGADEVRGKTIDIIDTMRLVIWQKLVPTVDGKLTALREYLIFDDDVRAKLLDVDPDDVTAATRQIVIDQKNTMYDSATEAYKSGLIAKDVYDKLVLRHKSANIDLKQKPSKRKTDD